MMFNRYNFIDLFAGCGGLSLGMEQAGFTPVFANEIWNVAAETYRRNRNLLESQVFVGDIKYLGENPSTALQKEAQAHPIPGAKTADASESIVVAAGYAKGYLDAIRKRGYCPWSTISCKNPLAVQMFVFPHTNQADVFSVNRETGIRGPLPPEKVKEEFPEFAAIELPFPSYYVWAVEVPANLKGSG